MDRTVDAQVKDGFRQLERTLQAGAQLHDCARCVPDRQDDEGSWRTLTDKARCFRPEAMLATALFALIPKLIVSPGDA
jgi:rhamnogalacturonyl hydrolase YesR